MKYHYKHLYHEIWNPPYDFIIIRPVNYIKKLRVKLKDIEISIRYLKRRLSYPKITKSEKETIERLLRGYQRTQKIYKVQGSILAA